MVIIDFWGKGVLWFRVSGYSLPELIILLGSPEQYGDSQGPRLERIKHSPHMLAATTSLHTQLPRVWVRQLGTLLP